MYYLVNMVRKCCMIWSFVVVIGYSISPVIFSWDAPFALETIQRLHQVFYIISDIASNAVLIAFKANFQQIIISSAISIGDW